MKALLRGVVAFAPLTVFAQEPPDVVVVTATRAPQSALEVPASVDRISGQEIHEDRQQVNLSESLARVPGIAVLNRQNYAQDLQVQSRGFGARSTFGVRGIRLIADGIPATMPDGQGQAATFSLSSADHIEVLRGPFSVLYGNSSGGVIAVETMDAPAEPTAEADVLFGSYRTWRAGFRFGGQFGGLNALGDLSRFETDGYRQHSFALRDQLNAKFRAGSFTVVANSLRQPDTQDPLGLTRAQFEQDPRQATPQAIQFNTKKTISQDQAGGTYRHDIGFGRVEAMAYAGQRSVEQFLAIPVATQLGPTHSGGVVDLDRNYGGAALRWFSRPGALRFAAGLEYDVMYERRRGYINNNGVVGALKRDEDNTVDSSAIYVQGEWEFARRWTLHAGARYTRVNFESNDYFIAAGNPNDSGSRSYQAATPVAGLLFRPSETLSVYGNLGRGFETPTFVELAYRRNGSGLNFDLNASNSTHAELGVKSVFPRRASVNAAVFKVVTENEIVVDTNSGGRAIYKNAGHTDRKGFEIAAQSLAAGPVQLRAAYTYLEATFRESFVTSITTTPATVVVPAGATLPGTAKNQFYGELRYGRSFWHTSLEMLHRSSVPVNDPNTDFADPFTVWNLSAGLEQQPARWRFTEFVRLDNLGNRNYIGSVIVNETNFRYFEPAPQRNWSVGARASLQF
jgi:iron complex outermembrane receptor protein